MELVRCRMCGGEAAHAEYVTSVMCVWCRKCGQETEYYSTLQEAFDAWNKLMGVTLDELESICHQSKCNCDLHIERIDEIGNAGCIINDLLDNRKELEKAVHEWRAKKYESCIINDLLDNRKELEKAVHEWRAKKNESGKANKSGR